MAAWKLAVVNYDWKNNSKNDFATIGSTIFGKVFLQLTFFSNFLQKFLHVHIHWNSCPFHLVCMLSIALNQIWVNAKIILSDFRARINCDTGLLIIRLL